MDLGTAIKLYRKQKNLKQNDFAAICDISPAYLSQIENNLREATVPTLRVIADNLQIPLPILFFLSLDDNDIAPNKRKAFAILSTPIKSMISSFFSETRHPNDY
jgi:XRE family transcriptional regulator, regulator of sulfur utilization